MGKPFIKERSPPRVFKKSEAPPGFLKKGFLKKGSHPQRRPWENYNICDI